MKVPFLPHAVCSRITSQPCNSTLTRFVVSTVLLLVGLSIAGLAQDQSPAQQTAKPPVTVPPGTRFELVLTNSISSKDVHRGDLVHAQLTSPITVGDQVVIPAGTYVQGPVDKLSRRGTQGEIQLQSAEIVFPDGYVAKAGAMHIETDEGTAWLNPSTRAKVGMFAAPLAGLGIGAGIGAAAHTTTSSTLGGNTITQSSPKGIAIGSFVGLAVGGAVALVLMARSHGFFVWVGAPMEMTVPEPITLAQNEIDGAMRAAAQNPPSIQPTLTPPVAMNYPTPAADNGTCFTPGDPGTPPTVIPGVPDANGIPGPPTIIPGTPPTPGTPYPCP